MANSRVHEKWIKSDRGADFLQFTNPDGSVPSWIDKNGFAGGNLLHSSGVTNSSTIFVSPSGDDANDGLTWGTAKNTIRGALFALPGGNSISLTIGSGVIYFLDGAAANTVANAGLWLMGANDPNYSSPPAGWLKVPNGFGSLSIIGIPTANYGPNPHLGRASLVGGSGLDNLHPGVWLSSTTVPLYFANININFPGRAWVMGVDSNNAITPANSGVTTATFYNCTGSVSGSAGLGPTWTIGGESFWIEFIDCGGAGSIGTGGHVATDDTAQAFLIDGRGSSGGQIVNFKGVTNLGQGGIKFYAGTNGDGVIAIDDCTEEGAFGQASPVAPILWMAGGPSNNIARVTNAIIADGGSATMPAVQNDMGPQCQVFVANAWGVVKNTQGPVISVADNSFQYQTLTKSPLQEGAAGFFGGWGSQFLKVAGLKDDTRRQFVSFSRFSNGISQVSSNWSGFNGGSITAGVAGPDNSTNAARVSTITDGGGVQFLRSGINFSVGDWVIIGAWVRANAGTGMVQRPLQIQMLTTGFTFVGGNSTLFAGSYIGGDGEYAWVMGAAKVATIGTNPSDTGYWGFTHPANVLDYCYPILWHIPTGTISDNEVYEIVHSLVSNRDDAPANSISTQRGAKFMTDGLQMPKITTVVAAPGAGMGFLRWEAGTNAGTLKLVAYAGTSTTGVTVLDNIGSGN